MKKTITKLLLFGALSLVLAGCGISVQTYSMEVVNQCVSSDLYTVSVYIDGDYQGDVTYTRTFYGIMPGTHYVLAQGDNGYYIDSDISFSSDMRWTLCP